MIVSSSNGSSACGRYHGSTPVDSVSVQFLDLLQILSAVTASTSITVHVAATTVNALVAQVLYKCCNCSNLPSSSICLYHGQSAKSNIQLSFSRLSGSRQYLITIANSCYIILCNHTGSFKYNPEVIAGSAVL